MEAKIRHGFKVIVFYCLLIVSQKHTTSGRVIGLCPNEDVMIQLQDIINNRYLMTCSKRCGQTVIVWDNPKAEQHLKSCRTTSCSCDSLCYIYNDCCHNFKQACPGEVKKFKERRKMFPKGMLETTPDGIGICREGYVSKPGRPKDPCLTKSYIVISECTLARRSCETIDIYDPNKFIPVYDQKTHLHYMHIMCAKCNAASNLQSWKYYINCLNPESERHLVKDDIRNTLEYNKCTIEIEPDAKMKGLRECLSDTVSSCPDSCANADLVDKCEKGPSCFASAYINKSHTDSTIHPNESSIVANYKNYYCGLCNGVSPDAIRCGNLYPVPRPLSNSVQLENSLSLTTLFEFDAEVGFYITYCPNDSFTIQNICITIPSKGNITFIYTFKSVKSWNGICDKSSPLKQLNHNETFDEVTKVFDDNNMNPIWTEITLEASDDDPSNGSLQMTFGVILNVRTSSDFLRCLKNVEYKIRSIAQDISHSQSFNGFSIAVRFENDKNVLQMEVPGIPTHCETDYTQTEGTENTHSHLHTQIETINGVEMKCHYREGKKNNGFNNLDIITYTCVCPSILFLLIRVCLQYYVPHFWSGPGKMQFNLAFALLMAFLAWVVGSYFPYYTQVCQAFAVIRYFAFMAAFAWMTNIAVDSWRLFRPHALLISPDETTTPLSLYHLFGWVGPLVLSALVFILDFLDISSVFKPNFGPPYCWILGKALIYYFYIPTGLLLLTNSCLFICTSLALRASFEESSVVVSKDKKNFQVYLKLFLLMGITWALGFVVGFTDTVSLEYVYILVNSLQGVFIFVAFVCTKRTFAHFVKMYRFYSKSSRSRSKTGSTPLSSSKSQ